MPAHNDSPARNHSYAVHAPRRDAGNVLFLILIGIALFAALSYAITQTGRGGTGGGLARENASINAAKIVAYSNSVAETVQRMRINGVDDLAFRGTACALPDCSGYIFDTGGGGNVLQAPPADVLDSANSGQATYGRWVVTSNGVRDIGTDGNGAASSELVLVLPWIKLDICKSLNDKLGVINQDDWPPRDMPSFTLTDFAGTYSTEMIMDSNMSQLLYKKKAGCFSATSVNGVAGATRHYHFYQVLLPR